ERPDGRRRARRAVRQRAARRSDRHTVDSAIRWQRRPARASGRAGRPSHPRRPGRVRRRLPGARVTLLQALALAGAGLAAGTASAMAGGASIITFPILLAMGVPPLTANVTNTVGLSPTLVGTGLGAIPELRTQRARIVALMPPALVGAVAGAILLLTPPTPAFQATVPALIAISCTLLLLQPWLVRHTLRGGRRQRWLAQLSTFVVGVYTGYFGAASGVLFLALVGLVSVASLHELNASKNLLVGAANAVA